MTTSDTEPTISENRRRSLLWGSAFVIGTFGTGTLARYFELDGWLTMAVMIPPMLLLIPFLRAVEKDNARSGNSSPAMHRYSKRALIFAFGYMAALFAAISATDMFKPEGVVAWALAILPSLPIAYMVYAMGRYLTEEEDEYLRMKAATAALIATGLLLVIATTWGFLESFGLVAHQPGWWAVPVWAVGLGLGQMIMKARES